MAAKPPVQLLSHTLRDMRTSDDDQARKEYFRNAYLKQASYDNTYAYHAIADVKLSFRGWDKITAWESKPWSNWVGFLSKYSDNFYNTSPHMSLQTDATPEPMLNTKFRDPPYYGNPQLRFGISRLETNSMSHWFSTCAFEVIDMFLFDTSRATDMTCLFSGCNRLKHLDVSTFNTSNVVRMDEMFSGCSSLPWLNLSSFDTRNVQRMDSMFQDCAALTSLDLSNFELDSLRSAVNMFKGCSNLKSLTLTGKAIKKLASLAQYPPLIMADCSSVPDEAVLKLSGAVNEDGVFVVGPSEAESSVEQ